MNASGLPANPVPGESDLVGLWRAKQRFGPELRGALTIERREEGWSAEIAGRTAPVRMEGDRLSFELPGGEGSFRGRLRKAGIVGHWIQPRTATGGTAYASPIWLENRRPGRWRGVVTPLEDEMTFYLPILASADGTLSAFL